MNAEDDLRTIALKIFDAIFSNQTQVELEGERYRVQRTRSGLRNVRYQGIFFVEQNPDTGSRYAEMAREGHQILWGIRGRTYLVRVIDGVARLL